MDVRRTVKALSNTAARVLAVPVLAALLCTLGPLPAFGQTPSPQEARALMEQDP
ncbi:MAG: hypothetical protein HKO53_05995, partial [Gemmatimonadetes bacterium]|nr:hypothetical protein [Gemmatimonadota bacterium]